MKMTTCVIFTAALMGPVSATIGAQAPEQPTSVPVAIQRTIAQAQSTMARGRPAAAAELFEQAAEHGEFVEAEVGEVRARLWAGQFRHAVAISNVVAGEHPDSAEAQALLAYVEDRSGYTAQALQRLQRERQSHPHDAAPVAAEGEILTDRHRAGDAIKTIDEWISANAPQADVCRIRARASLISQRAGLALPASQACAGVAANVAQGRAAAPAATAATAATAASAAAAATAPAATTTANDPSGWPEAATNKPPASEGVPVFAGNGLIIDGGHRVITTSLGAAERGPGETSIWVRNAQGELRRARLETSSDQDTAILSLSAPFPTEHSLPPESAASKNARGLCFALSFPASISTDAMLPAVTPCVAFDPRASDGASRINIPLSVGERGSPVFDAEGRLMGLADPSAGSPTRLVRTAKPLSPSTGLTSAHPASDGHGAQPTIAMPELYERLAPSVVQVIAMGQP